MKSKILIIFLIFFCNQKIFSQEKNENISIEFTKNSIKEALNKIENNTNYKFYYESKNIEKDTFLISQNFKNSKIIDILNSIFNGSTLNYYIDKNKVIITNNSLIVDSLPKDFFGETHTKSNEDILDDKPVFYQETDSSNNTVVLIGKEIKNSVKKNYILSGFIKNNKTSEPIPNLTLKLLNNKKSILSDKNGFYSISLPYGRNTIEVESLNYNKFFKKVMLYSDGKLDIFLSENINQLKEVIIKGKKNQTIRKAISGVTTLNSEGVKNIPLVLGERDILKVATTLPGIKTTGEGTAGFNVRGGKEDQNLILLDDAVLYNPSHFLGFFSALNPYTTNKVDIYKGSIPAEFGGRLSSVFDISSKNGNTNKLSGEGGIGPVTSNISLSTPILKEKSSLLFGGRATYSSWILKSLKEESLQNSQASFYDGIIKYNHKINQNNTLESTLYYSQDKFSISSDSLFKYSNRLLSIKWNHIYNSKAKSTIVITNSEYKFNIDYQTDGVNSFDYGFKINDTQFMLKFNYLLNNKHKFNYGVSSKLYQINPGFLHPKNTNSTLIPRSLENEKAIESAVYFSDNYKLSDKLLIDFGLRFSIYNALGKSSQNVYEKNLPKNDATIIDVKYYGNNKLIKTYSGFEPRIAIKYAINDNLSFKAGYDKTYQYIHLLSSNTTQSPTDTWILSNLNINPQSAQQFSLGMYKDLYSEILELSIEGYYKKSQKILDYKVGAELQLNENIETELLQGEGKAYGIEVLLKKEIGKLNGWLGYSYSRTLIQLNGNFEEEKVNNGEFFAANFDKPHDFSAVLNWKFTNRYSLSTNFVYQTGRPITYPIGKYQFGNSEYTLYSDRNKFRIPDYYRLDIGFNIEGNHKIKKLAHSFWNISVYNVLGRNNPYSIYFITKEGQIKAYKTSIFAIPVPTITYNFKF